MRKTETTQVDNLIQEQSNAIDRSAKLQAFFALLGAVLLHILGVVTGEFRERSGLVSAMITGEKKLTHRPVDL